MVKSTPDDWREAFELHVIHAARAIRACVPHMTQTGDGAVVIIASISGWKPAPRPQYGATKAAEIHLAMELGRELASERIRVNAVSLGSIFFPGGGWDSLREWDPRARGGPCGRLRWCRLAEAREPLSGSAPTATTTGFASDPPTSPSRR
ncbi:MAG: SDR family oxidoreductase [Pseudonocardiales bacterium]|nr:SDR family oxidoreductase [Pseudonocardiales bacterium]MBV9029051.1 SDR family oxidoreductase [Pseudonocardiales bacterium]